MVPTLHRRPTGFLSPPSFHLFFHASSTVCFLPPLVPVLLVLSLLLPPADGPPSFLHIPLVFAGDKYVFQICKRILGTGLSIDINRRQHFVRDLYFGSV